MGFVFKFSIAMVNIDNDISGKSEFTQYIQNHINLLGVSALITANLSELIEPIPNIALIFRRLKKADSVIDSIEGYLITDKQKVSNENCSFKS